MNAPTVPVLSPLSSLLLAYFLTALLSPISSKLQARRSTCVSGKCRRASLVTVRSNVEEGALTLGSRQGCLNWLTMVTVGVHLKG